MYNYIDSRPSTFIIPAFEFPCFLTVVVKMLEKAHHSNNDVKFDVCHWYLVVSSLPVVSRLAPRNNIGHVT